MKQHEWSGCFNFRQTAEFLQETFANANDIEVLLTTIDKAIRERPEAGAEARSLASRLANDDKPALVQAIREWFTEIRERHEDESYELLAKEIIRPDDCVITFNYDVSLDRQLMLAGVWEIGDGYGFPIEGLPTGTSVKLLKLHGSANWLAGIFAGMGLGSFAVGSGGAFGERPLIPDSELRFLGYEHSIDPRFPRGGATAIPPMILPSGCKQFYFETSFGREGESFWDSLWNEAEEALQRSDRVAICGYGLLPVDERACRLLLEGQLSASVEVCCGDDTARVVQKLRDCGRNARSAEHVLFQDWVASVVAK